MIQFWGSLKPDLENLMNPRTEGERIYTMRDGTVVRYGKSSFDDPEHPERPLWYVQMRPGVAWIVDQACATPASIDLLGSDQNISHSSYSWNKVAWACIMFGGDKYNNAPHWANELRSRMNWRKENQLSPPNYPKVLERLRIEQQDRERRDRQLWRRFLRFLLRFF